MTDLEQKGPKNQQKFEIFSYFQSGIFAEDMVYIVQKLITYRVLIFFISILNQMSLNWETITHLILSAHLG